MLFIRGEKGFTLVEMLIVISIMGLIIAAAYSFYFSGLRGWRSGVDRMDYQQSARIVVERIVDEIRFAGWVEVVAGGAEVRYQFNDDSKIYGFKSTASGALVMIHQEPGKNETQTQIALGIKDLLFVFDEEDKSLRIMVKVGEESHSVSMQSSVRPRNMP